MSHTQNSVKVFLQQCRSALDSKSDDTHALDIVSGNESADLDSLTSSVLYAYISTYASELEKHSTLSVPIVNIPRSDLQLRPEFTALLAHAGLKLDDLATLDEVLQVPQQRDVKLTLVDHNAPTGSLKERYGDRVAGCIDHHADEGVVPKSCQPRIIAKSGSCTSLVVQYLSSGWDRMATQSNTSGAAHGQGDEYVGDDASLAKHWDAQVAKLGMGSILIDTHNLQDESKVTDHDRKAVEYLQAKILGAPGGASWDRGAFFAEIDRAKRDLDRLSVADCLRKDYKLWNEGGVNLGFSSVVKPIKWLVSKSESMEDFLTELQEFREGRQLHVFVLMTAFTGDDDDFRRELLIWAKGEDVVRRTKIFAEQGKEKLGLTTWDGEHEKINTSHEASFRHVWLQSKVQHSRKAVAPLLRESFKE